MMNVGSPKLLVISDSEPVDHQEEEEEEELQFETRVTPHERLKATLSSLLSHLLSLIQFLGACLQRVRGRRGRVSHEAAEEEGRGSSQESLDHTHQRVEPEVTPEVIQRELEAATPLPGETTPPGEPAKWTQWGDDERVDPVLVPLPPSNSNLAPNPTP